MSTRGLITFKGTEDYPGDYNVYKHSDMYPTGAAETLTLTQEWFAWKTPRYEADEFAAAFVTAGKAWFLLDGKKVDTSKVDYHPGGNYRNFSGGGVRLMPSGEPIQVAVENCGDIQYRYEIEQRTVKGKPELWITAFAGNWWEKEKIEEVKIIKCRLIDFPKEAAKKEAA